MSSDIIRLDQFFSDLRQIRFRLRLVKKCPDGFQLFDLCTCLFDQFTQSFEGPFLLLIFFKETFRVFRSGFILIKRDPDLLVIIILVRDHDEPVAGFSAVSVCVEQLSVDAELLTLFRILQLPVLQVQLS